MIFTRIPNNILKVIAWITIIVGVASGVYAWYFFSYHNIIFTPEGETPDFTVTGPIGDFIGGVIGTILSFAATLFVVITLNEQSYQHKRELFAQNYYEMLKIHNDNVSSMVLHQSNGKDIISRDVFTKLIKDYERVYDYVHSYMLSIVNGAVNDTTDIKSMKEYLANPQNMQSLEMRIAYGYYFYGSDVYHLQDPKIPIEKTIEETIFNLMKVANTVVYGKHVLLGHYYRHIYHMVMQIIAEKNITETERYTYAKQLRAQLNDNEQILLYYNALSEVGREWLVRPNSNKEIKTTKQMSPMARFRMIKNIRLEGVTKGVKPEEVFKNEIAIYKKNNKNFFELKLI